MIDKIIQLSDQYESHTIEVRRTIHVHPELSMQEYETAKLVRKELEAMGIPYTISPVETGTIAEIDSGKPGKLLLLRADMDALPIEEQTGLPFASKIPNIMHACGHDVHTANLLAVGRILNETKEYWNGRVKLVFQPAEEKGGGGSQMIKQGLFAEIPDACMAMHVDINEPGTVKIIPGTASAYSDSCHIVIHGQATHSSKPETGVDAVQIAGAVITALYQITAKNISPLEPSTLNIGRISGGSASNIVADEVHLHLMMRNTSDEARRAMFDSIERITKGLALSMGGNAEVHFKGGYTAVQNDPDVCDFVANLVKSHKDAIYSGISSIPENHLICGKEIWLGAEDFGFYTKKAPSVFIRMGIGTTANLHTEKFLVDENAIKIMTRVMCLAAAEFLQ